MVYLKRGQEKRCMIRDMQREESNENTYLKKKKEKEKIKVRLKITL